MNRIENISDGMKAGMRSLASGIAIVTATNTQTDERAAMTASSITSVSGEPPSLLVCVNREAGLDRILQASERFCVNILGASHRGLSDVCATPNNAEERFVSELWEQHTRSHLYYISDAPSVFICQKQKVIEHGTHHIYIGDIEEVMLSELTQDKLVYADGAYHTL